MRIEKGHVAGSELNGQTTARDLGLGKMVSAKKDFIGRVMAARPALTDPARPTLVGLRPVDRGERLRAGAHFIRDGAEATAENDQGYVTSVAFSPSLGHWIGLGLLARGPERTARSCAPAIPCAAATCWSRSARPASSIRKESACVAEPPPSPRLGACRHRHPGPLSAAKDGEPGVTHRGARRARARDGHARKGAGGGAAARRSRAAYGVELPDSLAARRRAGGELSSATGPGQWLAVSERLRRRRSPRDLVATAHGPRLDLRPERRADGAAHQRAARPRRAGQGPADRPCTRAPSRRERRHQHDLADGRAAVADRRRADLRHRRLPQRRAASGAGSPPRPPSSATPSKHREVDRQPPAHPRRRTAPGDTPTITAAKVRASTTRARAHLVADRGGEQAVADEHREVIAMNTALSAHLPAGRSRRD